MPNAQCRIGLRLIMHYKDASWGRLFVYVLIVAVVNFVFKGK